MSAPKLCKDCRWIRTVEFLGTAVDADLSLCGHPSAVFEKDDLVTGEHKVFQLPCQSARSHRNLCGPDGKHWEPVQPPGFVP